MLNEKVEKFVAAGNKELKEMGIDVDVVCFYASQYGNGDIGIEFLGGTGGHYYFGIERPRETIEIVNEQDPSIQRGLEVMEMKKNGGIKCKCCGNEISADDITFWDEGLCNQCVDGDRADMMD